MRGAFGSRPDLPSGEQYVDEVRGHRGDSGRMVASRPAPYYVEVVNRSKLEKTLADHDPFEISD